MKAKGMATCQGRSLMTMGTTPCAKASKMRRELGAFPDVIIRANLERRSRCSYRAEANVLWYEQLTHLSKQLGLFCALTARRGLCATSFRGKNNDSPGHLPADNIYAAPARLGTTSEPQGLDAGTPGHACGTPRHSEACGNVTLPGEACVERVVDGAHKGHVVFCQLHDFLCYLSAEVQVRRGIQVSCGASGGSDIFRVRCIH